MTRREVSFVNFLRDDALRWVRVIDDIEGCVTNSANCNAENDEFCPIAKTNLAADDAIGKLLYC